jgi:hypothetical protein
VHLLCVFVLPFSNWLWATVCLSESMAAMRKGVHLLACGLERSRCAAAVMTESARA